ncbi:PREDICTED: serine/arginine repetitive matrix protein 1 [Vollenhovia emeryi]|uniref:serine/arginine repetitive matrix protein 1 n=1 Tax=Vollenhovia emeryi TaxID=411798 RepID=UPI0005F37C89|nr:PREDICTED: serine/arginine repetitive matrix protein 1 [Vollenhovia emeryi]XP_011865022.1 PREDICTED: serine/arginine repetitive matrix protein 1 [Vollenhovia emeryi]
MQLATSQRPHPPPVPPRPSRQVVAEALKRSPRPPCPTRQAPPPPNTKPWRSDQQQVQQQQQQQQQQLQQQQVDATGGRTIVYESIKECTKDYKDESVSNDKNQRDGNQTRNTDRNVEDGRSENGGRVTSSHDQPHGAGAGSEKPYSTGNVPVNIVRKRNSLTEDQRPQRRLEIRRNSRGKEPAGGLSCHRERCKDTPGKDQQRENSVVATAEKFDTAATRPTLAVRAVNVSFEDERAASSSPDSGGRVTVSHAEKCNGDPERADGRDSRPTPTCRSSPGEQRSQRQQQREAASGKPAGSDAVRTVSSSERSTSVPCVDRAATTLLVVEEPERKIALSDHEDSNDNDSDNNIHRQDWLEAGIRYSSTQITLHGDDGDDDDDDDDGVVNRDRVNGYDHREEERITDLDFISIQERIAMSSLQGLPPLPRSLSGFNLSGGRGDSGEPPPPPTRSSSKSQRGGKTPLQSSSTRPSPPTRQLTTLDTQLAVLRREMFGLRQLDLSLLSQLWSLNESIQEFRQLLQEQEDRAPSPSPSSEEGDDTSYGVHPPPPPRRPAPTLHHHRPPRPPRPPRPSASDESPSSEEYGAV